MHERVFYEGLLVGEIAGRSLDGSPPNSCPRRPKGRGDQGGADARAARPWQIHQFAPARRTGEGWTIFFRVLVAASQSHSGSAEVRPAIRVMEQRA